MTGADADFAPTRRAFLLGLLAIGLSPIRPDPDGAAEVSENALLRQVEAVLHRHPMQFLVDDGGTIELANYLPVPDRFTAYDVSAEDLDLEYGAHDLLDRIEALRCEIYWYAIDLRGEVDGLEDWETEMVTEVLEALSPAEREALKLHLLSWFAGRVTREERDDSDIVRPVDGRSWAFRVFGCDDSLLEAFDVVLVEGDNPGSTYVAAELRRAVEEANHVAVGLGLPIVFDRAP